MSSGVLYVVSGDKYVKEALYSASTLRKYCNLPITLFTDRPVDGKYFDEVRIIKSDHKRPKVDILKDTPYKNTLYLDSDTKILMDVSGVFSLLERFDIAAAHDHSRVNSRLAGTIPEYGSIDYAFPEYNSGVIFYNNSEKTEKFFQLWRGYYYKYAEITKFRDQPSFRIALWQSQIALHALPFEYNIRCQAIRNKMKKQSATRDSNTLAPRIHHWHGVGQTSWVQAFHPRYKPMKF